MKTRTIVPSDKKNLDGSIRVDSRSGNYNILSPMHSGKYEGSREFQSSRLKRDQSVNKIKPQSTPPLGKNPNPN